MGLFLFLNLLAFVFGITVKSCLARYWVGVSLGAALSYLLSGSIVVALTSLYRDAPIYFPGIRYFLDGDAAAAWANCLFVAFPLTAAIWAHRSMRRVKGDHRKKLHELRDMHCAIVGFVVLINVSFLVFGF